jgi:hypothetical protein
MSLAPWGIGLIPYDQTARRCGYDLSIKARMLSAVLAPKGMSVRLTQADVTLRVPSSRKRFKSVAIQGVKEHYCRVVVAGELLGWALAGSRGCKFVLRVVQGSGTIDMPCLAEPNPKLDQWPPSTPVGVLGTLVPNPSTEGYVCVCGEVFGPEGVCSCRSKHLRSSDL